MHQKIIKQTKTRLRKIWRERIQLERDMEDLDKKEKNLLREAENILLRGLLDSRGAKWDRF